MIIQKISSEVAKVLCDKIITDLPEYFGLPESNEQYVLGVSRCENFAAKVDENYVRFIVKYRLL